VRVCPLTTTLSLIGSHQVDASGRRTAAAALRNCVYLLPVGAAAVVLEVCGPWLLAEATAVTALMGACAARFYVVRGSLPPMTPCSLRELTVLGSTPTSLTQGANP